MLCLFIPLVNKKFFFQKSLNVKMILGYIKIAEPKYALSFFELALDFEIQRNYFFRISAY